MQNGDKIHEWGKHYLEIKKKTAVLEFVACSLTYIQHDPQRLESDIILYIMKELMG